MSFQIIPRAVTRFSENPVSRLVIRPAEETILECAQKPVLEEFKNLGVSFFLPGRTDMSTFDFLAKCIFNAPSKPVETKVCLSEGQLSGLGKIVTMTFVNRDYGTIFTALFHKGRTTPFSAGRNELRHKGRLIPKALQPPSFDEVSEKTISLAAQKFAEYMGANTNSFPAGKNPFKSRYCGGF